MEKLHFSITINAPKEKVWSTMLDQATYRVWTEPFSAGSSYRGDWSEGSKILFVAPNKEGKEEGMVSRIAENRLHEFVSIEHVGFMKDGVEDTTSDEVKEWAGAHENYTFTQKDNGTEVVVDIDVADSFKEEFEKMWPKALQKLKEIAEA